MSKDFDKTKQDSLFRSLGSLGFTVKEAAVYVALLQLGEVGSSKIITATGLHGQYVYQALGALEGKGMAQHVVRNGRKKFSAKNPRTLAQLIEQQKRVAETVVEQLQEMLVLPPQQQFEVFQGSESYVAHEFDLLMQAPEGSELLVIGGTGDRFYQAMGNQLNAYEAVRVKKKITVRYLGSEGQKLDLLKGKQERKFFDYRVLPGLFTGMVNTNIWPDVLGFNVFGEPVTSFMVASSVVAGSYRQFFETLWKLGRTG